MRGVKLMKAYYETVFDHHKSFHVGGVTTFYNHFHAAVEMVITLSGNQIFNVEDEIMDLPEGGVGIAFPFQEHGYDVSESKTKARKIAFIVPSEILDTPERQYSRCLPITPFYIYKGNELKKLNAMLLPLIMASDEKNEPPRINIDDRIWYRELIRSLIYFHLEHTGVTEYDSGITDSRLLQKVMLYLDGHYENCDFSVKATADELGVSYKYLSNMVKKSTGYALVDHLHNLRVAKARRMLTDTPTSITEIAFESGFSSLRTFNRVFMKYTGKTPTDYRVTKGAD